MNYEDIVEKLAELLVPLAEGRVATIGEGTELTGELELDSVKVMELVVEVEDAFDISYPINELAEVRTVGDLARSIQKVLGQHA